MIIFPNCKINLGLYVTARRSDGYHDLETVFYPVPLEDSLEITPATTDADCLLHCYGNTVEGGTEDNLVVKAYRLLQKDFNLPNIDVSLLKHIPSGAGLGGGSADATFMLRLLNDYAHLQLSDEQLETYAARLGADCAFFVRNVPMLARGIGNLFTEINLSLKGYKIVVVKPDIFVSTREAFALIKPQKPKYDLAQTIALPIERWRERLHNDFEDSVFPQHPELALIKEKLYQQGALYAAMSGSGSSLFGLFPADYEADSSSFTGHFYFCSSLL
jgi:4-diphosphocytidyl-2-C-methyl-D-erythritol kinase